jgi:hypothetical protein
MMEITNDCGLTVAAKPLVTALSYAVDLWIESAMNLLIGQVFNVNRTGAPCERKKETLRAANSLFFKVGESKTFR